MSEFIIAKYIRLSIDDSKSESMSIENQRLMLEKHIETLDVKGAQVLEYVDNGFTGTNFERPAVQQLLELVRAGGVNCIVVKDFSRFGRNAIDVGYFIERIFPMYRVRFIAISDGYDSVDYNGDTGGLEVALKFLMHEQYSRDLSKKIKSAVHEKMRRGERVTKNCLFGYTLNENRELVIDEPAAETVRRIFSLADTGIGVTKIAKILYDEKRLTPSAHQGRKKNNECIWEAAAISDILKNEQYIGMYIVGKTKKVEVGNKKVIRLPENQWIKIPNLHPAIIDKDLFDDVQFLRQQSRKNKIKEPAGSKCKNHKTHNPLKGKVVCGSCNHVMYLNNAKNSKFCCKFSLAAHDALCHRFSIGVSDLSNKIFEQLREQSRILLENAKTALSNTTVNSEENLQIVQIEDKKLANYEKFILGEICSEEYKALNLALNAQQSREKQVQSVSTQNAAQHSMIGEYQKIARQVLDAKELTRHVVDAMISKVRVFPGGKINIIWHDSIKRMIDNNQESAPVAAKIDQYNDSAHW